MVETAPETAPEKVPERAQGTPGVAAGGADAAYAPTVATLPSRGRERVRYDRRTVHAVLDEALVCHLGFVAEGAPVVLPTVHARVGERLYLHGSTGSRPLRHAATYGLPVCVTVTLVDGIVLARSATHHSANYRSVVVHGLARLVAGEAEKRSALDAIVDHVMPGRSRDCRAPSAKELAAVAVLRVDLVEVSAKVRTGWPKEEEADLALPHWAGVLPLRTVAQAPLPDPRMDPSVPVPEYVVAYGAGAGAGADVDAEGGEGPASGGSPGLSSVPAAP